MDDLFNCEPNDVSLKTFFLGPQAENREWLMRAVQYIFNSWFQWRHDYYPKDGVAISAANLGQPEFLDKQNELMNQLKFLLHRFEDEVPKFTPRYVGHMLSEQSLPALLGHIVTLLHNPNNVSGEASKVGIQIEKEAIQDLCAMVGWDRKSSIGHFTSGGTIANFEALLRAKHRLFQWLSLGTFLCEKKIAEGSLFEMAHMGWEKFDQFISKIDLSEFSEWKKLWLVNPIRFAARVSEVFKVAFEGPVLLVSQSKHYSWPKGTQLLGMGSDRLISIELDKAGRMDPQHLQQTIKNCRDRQQAIIGVVTVAGTTELGTVDPIDQITSELTQWELNGIHLWHHVDAAYGGFLLSMRGITESGPMVGLLKSLHAVPRTNSITIDPHKLGYVPYSSGVILVKNKREYAYQEIQAPYIQFDTTKDVGLQTLEGSRSAAGAVATWLTEKSIGLHAEGYGRILSRTISVKNYIQSLLRERHKDFRFPEGLDSNVLCMLIAKDKEPLSLINERTKKIYSKMGPGAKGQFIISKTTLKFENYNSLLKHFCAENSIEVDSGEVDLLRLCLMNPFILSKETKVFYPKALVDELAQFI